MLPGDLVVRIPGLHCHDLWFNPWLGNWGPAIWDHRALCRQKIQEGKFHIFPIFRERATNSSSCTEYSPRPDPALHALYGSCHLIATFSGGGNWVAASESPGTRLWTQDFSFQSSCPLSPHSRDKKELLNEWMIMGDESRHLLIIWRHIRPIRAYLGQSRFTGFFSISYFSTALGIMTFWFTLIISCLQHLQKIKIEGNLNQHI